jgi:hypothetical protein
MRSFLADLPAAIGWAWRREGWPGKLLVLWFFFSLGWAAVSVVNHVGPLFQ